MAGVFTIARGAKTFVDVVLVTIEERGAAGRGEATPIYYHGETAESVASQITSLADAIAAGVTRDDLLTLLPRGAARNAVDAALWDLDAKLYNVPVWQQMNGLPLRPSITAFTLSLDEPSAMEARAREAAARYPLLKLKLAGDGDLDRVAAVRRGAPQARLIVDANEAWTGRDVVVEAASLVPFGVELIEQPVKAGADHLLDDVTSPIPFCADESCQDRADLARCIGRYAAINIKLDKCGGLSEAIMLAEEARHYGLSIMVGCMLSTSLGVAPAFVLGQQAQWLDLDGPLLLAHDREHGFQFAGGTMAPPPPGLWG